MIVFLLFTLCRLVFYIYNHDLYNERAFGQLLTIFIGGLRFDATAIIYTNLLYLMMFLIPFRIRYNLTYQAVGKYIYFITNGFALLLNCMDTVYFRNTLRRTTLSVFKEFSNDEKIGNIFAGAFVENWYLVLFFIGIIVLMVRCYGKPSDSSSTLIRNPWAYYPACTLGMVVCFTILVVGIRGGISDDRPLNINHSGAYASTAIDVPLVLNTPFTVYKSVDKDEIAPLVFFETETELDSVYTPVHEPAEGVVCNNMNVMIIILESFSRECFGFYNEDLENGKYKGYTPFLDTLISKHSFTRMYSYGNGRKSIDATVSALMSIPAIPEPFVLSGYFNNETRSLPVLLREKGYETAFFCGHPNGTMGYDALSNIIGFHRYFGMNEYGNDADYDGVWGIWDEDFLQYTALEMSNLKQPFLSTLFTVTSHGPYQLPKHRENEFEHGPEPIHRCIRYTDDALKRFFETAATQPWFNNTLFVLVADHVNIITHDEYKTAPELFAVPVIFYKPGGSLRKTERRVIQQIDIMPTVLGYLGYDQPYLAFGFDVNRSKDNFAFNYFNGTYQLITDDYLLIFDGQKTTGLYELHVDKFLTQNLVDSHPEVIGILEPKAKAFLQQYTTRMVENRLTVR